MKQLLTVTSALEIGAGVALMIAPHAVVRHLLGSTPDSPSCDVLARILAAALVSLGVAAWLARNEPRERAAAGLIVALEVYNVAAVLLLTYAGLILGLWTVVLWIGAVIHSVLAVWCARCLRSLLGRAQRTNP